jgi:Na+:H+ antiporter, NhaA family
MAINLSMFGKFFHSEKAGGFILIGCTLISLAVTNTGIGPEIIHLLHSHIDLSFAFLDLDYSVEHWINDGLMTIFFLLIGLEIERELYIGELSSLKNALLPILAAIGGMVVPAGIHLFFNYGSATQSGFGIPMATDIAFAIGILSLAGNRIPVSLKVFLTALAIIDDLGAITVIAIFYTKAFSLYYFAAAMGMFLLLFILGKYFNVYRLAVYLIGGVVMWYCLLKSGVHATISGVLLAFAIPFHKLDELNPSFKLQHMLHYPVAFVILPVFALVNTAIIFPAEPLEGLSTNNSLGIMLGLVVGKFIGITFICWLAVKSRIASLSPDIGWRLLMGMALLAGIGFTMSIFITNLAFSDPVTVTNSKMSILAASLIAAISGLIMLLWKEKVPAVKHI